MLLFLDTEFTGLHLNPGLISLALVDETGKRTFYAELPEESYRSRCTDWVVENVLPLLEGGNSVLPIDELRIRLQEWIESFGDLAMLITDSPDYDFELIKLLFAGYWPSNLAKQPMQFDSYAMGEDHQITLESAMKSYHSPERPEHHALHDAIALRAGMVAALDLGWWPK
jgi:hypothetical protein